MLLMCGRPLIIGASSLKKGNPTCLRPGSEGKAPEMFSGRSEAVLLEGILTQNPPIATTPSIDFTYPNFRHVVRSCPKLACRALAKAAVMYQGAYIGKPCVVTGDSGNCSGTRYSEQPKQRRMAPFCMFGSLISMGLGGLLLKIHRFAWLL